MTMMFRSRKNTELNRKSSLHIVYAVLFEKPHKKQNVDRENLEKEKMFCVIFFSLSLHLSACRFHRFFFLFSFEASFSYQA